jgi:acetylornithine deacetylase
LTSAENSVQPERLKRLLRELVDTYSPSGKEEEILEYLHGYLKRQGLPVVKQKVDDNRYNLVVFPPNPSDTYLCFVGHVDTVTAHDLENYGLEEDKGILSGLGITDMKAGCAAMIEAFTAHAAGASPFPLVGLALVVGEEEESDGAEALVDEYRFPWAVIGEPTNLLPCLGHYGYLEVHLVTKGKRAHSSMPELGRNAIENMLKLLLQVTAYASSAPSGLVYNIREFTGFPGGFVVPDSCESWLDMHLPPHSDIDVLKAELEQVVAKADREIPGLNAIVRFETAHSGYRVSQDRKLVKKLRTIFEKLSLPWEPQDFRSHSDGNVLWASGIDPIVLGPGSLEKAHTAEESVAFDQVLKASELYLAIARSVK